MEKKKKKDQSPTTPWKSPLHRLKAFSIGPTS
jgi:hypothetical protein